MELMVGGCVQVLVSAVREGLSQETALELRPEGVRVSGANPLSQSVSRQRGGKCKGPGGRSCCGMSREQHLA